VPSIAKSKIRFGFVAGLLTLVFTALASHNTQLRSVEAFQRVDHTREVLFKLEQILTMLLTIETATQGYVISGDKSLLESVEADADQINVLRKAVRQLTFEDQQQQKRLDLLEPLIAKHISDLRDQAKKGVVSLGTASGIRKSGGIEETHRRIMEMEAIENGQLNHRIAAAQAADRKTLGVIFTGSLLSVLLMGLASIRIRRDASRLEAAEISAKDARDYAEGIVETVRQPLLVVTRDWFVRSANRAFYQRFKLNSEQVQGKSFYEMAQGGWNIPALRQGLESVVTQNQSLRDFELEHEFPGVGLCTFLIDAHAFEHSKDKSELILLAFEDITESKQSFKRINQLNSELRDRASQLEDANKELEAFSYSVSHDLRAPVRHINGFTDLLRKSSDERLTDSGRRYLGTIAESARHMGRLIDDLLGFSRMGKQQLRRQDVDLNLLVEDAIRAQHLDTTGRQIQWIKHPLPLVVGDSSLLRQVLDNLIGNAVKYSRSRTPAKIEIGSVDELEENVIFVRDNGVGFDAQYVHRLFGVFQRLHTVDEFEGTGIGLANVRRIISRHSGRTWAEGKPDEGATFYFSLPKTKT
jgi:signal transduction histidine kinase